MGGAPQTYRRSGDVVFRKILDEHMLVPVRGKVADMQRVFALNPVGAAIWEALDGARDVAAIAEHIAHLFTVEHSAAMADVERFLGELRREGLIEAGGG